MERRKDANFATKFGKKNFYNGFFDWSSLLGLVLKALVFASFLGKEKI
jgi:hypothetical protein